MKSLLLIVIHAALKPWAKSRGYELVLTDNESCQDIDITTVGGVAYRIQVVRVN
jgi:hypothetical protein